MATTADEVWQLLGELTQSQKDYCKNNPEKLIADSEKLIADSKKLIANSKR